MEKKTKSKTSGNPAWLGDCGFGCKYKKAEKLLEYELIRNAADFCFCLKCGVVDGIALLLKNVQKILITRTQ